MANVQLIVYLRISPGNKNKARLGIEAQREAIARFVAAEKFKIGAEHVETCKSSAELQHRPVLVVALAEAKARHCSIVVATLDRLSRDANFVTFIISTGVPVVVTGLGGDNPAFTLQPYSGGIKAWIPKAPNSVPPVIARAVAMRADGMTLRAIAEGLNADGLAAPAGGQWQAAQVHRILLKYAK